MSEQDPVARLSKVEASTAELQKAVGVVFNKLDAQDAKLDGITATLHKLTASAGPGVQGLLTMGAAVVVIAGAFGALVVHLASSAGHEEIRKADRERHQIELRLVRLETVLALATVRRSPGVAYTPDAVEALR
jgi:hypothetical protein